MRRALLIAMLLVSIYSVDALALEKGNPTGYYVWDEIISSDGKHKSIDNDYIALFLNGTLVTDYDVIIRNDRSLVPVRFISQELGAVVEWDAAKQLVSIKKDGNEIVMTINSRNVLVNGDELLLDCPAVLHNDSTYVPLRFISENLDATVSYSPKLESEYVYYYDTQMPISPADTIIRDFPNIIIDEKYDSSQAISKEEAMEKTKAVCLEGLENFKRSVIENFTNEEEGRERVNSDDFRSIEIEINRMLYLGEVSRYYKFTIGPYDILYDKYNNKIFFEIYSSGIIVKEVDVYEKALFSPVFIVG